MSVVSLPIHSLAGKWVGVGGGRRTWRETFLRHQRVSRIRSSRVRMANDKTTKQRVGTYIPPQQNLTPRLIQHSSDDDRVGARVHDVVQAFFSLASVYRIPEYRSDFDFDFDFDCESEQESDWGGEVRVRIEIGLIVRSTVVG